jgi:LPXTG-motif cell wall-anchored protein
MRISTAVPMILLAATAVSLPVAALAAVVPVKNTVVYVGGNDVVVTRSTDGITYSYEVAAGTQFKTASGSVAVSGLTPGAIIDGPLPGSGKVVDDAAVTSGKVVSVTPPKGLLVGVAGENKALTFPDGMVKIGGKDVPVGSVKAGDTIDVTMVSVRTDGDNRPLGSVKPPAMSGSLAIFQEPNLELPDTGTNLPTYGVIGGLLLVLGFGLKARKRATVNAR